MDGDGLRHELVRAPPVDSRVIVHAPLRRVPVGRLLSPVEPPPHQLILRPPQLRHRNLRRRYSLHQVPRQRVAHAGHVAGVGVLAGAGDAVTEVEVMPAERPQRRRQRRHSDEGVVVGLHHVVVPPGEDPREGGEEGVGLAGVHILGAIEDDDVAEAEDLQRHQEALLLGGEPA